MPAPSDKHKHNPADNAAEQSGERIAKFVSRSGGPSRRETERLIEQGRVSVNGKILKNPVYFVQKDDIVIVDNKVMDMPEPARLWAFHKPVGCITAEKDPEGRTTIYDLLPSDMPRLLTVGRLDYNSEGLLLMTNDGGLKRVLELPKTAITRRYRVRVFGRVTQESLDKLARGIVVNRVHYAPAIAEIDKIQGSNAWLTITIEEGKNREIRNMMSHLGYEVNRLIRTDYGPFALKDLPVGAIMPVPQFYLKQSLAELKIIL